ncbi:hypothetical protein [Caulobacter sp. 17J80-11]|uniref:hypothetical protein n=1 Tax=Caulobacter sp. 17J80-11 TaxID=2763502 RepID=UPI001653AE2F|nr:hypothetical protein [Caulobacter sp. 17J80-11]MBC6981546.1 hypothetical protein [Caulobacter sp. 17J80-11]
MLKGACAALVVVATAFPGVAGAAPDVPTAAEVARLESALTLPKGARALYDYDRYYARSVVDGRPVILGLYQRTWIRDVKEHQQRNPQNWNMASPQRVGEVQRVRKAGLPREISDGGCEQIRVVFDLEANKVSEASCNGAAPPPAPAAPTAPATPAA